MPVDDDATRAAALLERLLTDAAFRSRFRSDPAAVCAEYGLPELAQTIGEGSALQTLEIRESRSSLAGALMAAAGEGAGALDSIRQLHEHHAFSPDAARVVHRVLSNPHLKAVPHAQPHPPPEALDAKGPSSAPGASGVFEALRPGGAHPEFAGPGSTVQFLPAVHGHHRVAEPRPTHETPVDPASEGDPGVLPDPRDPYPGDNASPAAIAGWMARHAHKAGLPGELPVMAALVESHLHNVDYGDRDSLGFFQMRESVWGRLYPNYAKHPDQQLKWFIDQALAVQKEHIDAGDRSFGEDDSDWGSWVADVERPAENLRFKYQLQLQSAREHLTDPAAAGAARAALDHGEALLHLDQAAQGSAAVAYARQFLGIPYLWGGTTPRGFDCSGLVQYVWHHEGVDLPRVADQQFLVGAHVSRAELAPGDLIYFRNSTGYIHHVGMYIGGDRFIHAPHTGDIIKISNLNEPYYAAQFAGGRRVEELAEPGAVPTEAPPSPASEPAAGSGVFSALGEGSQAPQAPGSTVQFLPSVEPPQDESSPST
jgi:cell wall-associated NlpC family hydrolase